jgi:hypothetical protein
LSDANESDFKLGKVAGAHESLDHFTVEKFHDDYHDFRPLERSGLSITNLAEDNSLYRIH